MILVADATGEWKLVGSRSAWIMAPGTRGNILRGPVHGLGVLVIARPDEYVRGPSVTDF
jgi:hypothetical protein